MKKQTTILSPIQTVMGENVTVPDKLIPSLPASAGYDAESIASDLQAMFEGKPRRKLKSVVNDWKSNNLLWSAYSEFEDKVTRQAIDYTKFFSAFPRTQAFKAMKASGKKPSELAQDLINSMSEKYDLPAIGKRAQNLPFELTGSPTENTWAIASIIDKLKLQYERRYPNQRTEERTPSMIPDTDLDIIPLKDLSATNIMKVCLQDQLRDDSEYYQRLIDRTLTQIQYVSVTEQPAPPKHIEMLIDVSGSMNEKMTDGNTRAAYAIASAICLLKTILKGNHHILTIKTFDDEVYPPISGTPSEMINSLMNLQFTGGNTKIDLALQSAATDKSNDVILITDGNDSVETKSLPYALVTYQCVQRKSETNRSLKNISAEFYCIE